jgi:hypothetical protein
MRQEIINVLYCKIFKQPGVFKFTNNMDASRVTIVITTSPTRSNPSTKIIETVVESFARVQGLLECNKIIVFDGHFTLDDHKLLYKSGRIGTAESHAYSQYIENVYNLIDTHPAFKNTTPIVCQERMGFAYAVKVGLERVMTPYVMVVQHDYAFVCDDIPLTKILDTMDARKDINYVGFMSTSNLPYLGQNNHIVNNLKRQGIRLTMKAEDTPIPLVKLLFWFDKNHIARVDYYNQVVLAKRSVVRKGDFIEDRLGKLIKRRIEEGGDEAHQKFGTYFYHPEDPKLQVKHLDGRKWLDSNQLVVHHPKAIPKEIKL